MAGQLYLRKEAIERAVTQVEFAKMHNYPQGWIDDRMVELRHQVKMFRGVAEDAKRSHALEFGYETFPEVNVKDLMDMGY